jgi:multidrug efflux system outer membrane protein
VQQSGNYVTATTYTLGLSTSFELDVWGRLRRAEYAVRDQLYASQYARDTVAISLAASIARAYFTVRSLDAQLVASRETLQAANESLGLARKRLAGGVASELDVAQAGSLRAQASAQLTELERQRSTVVHQLGVLTGRLDLVVAPGDFNALPVPPLAPAGLPSQLLERRPDVREAEATLEAATEQVGFARGSQFPALSLTASGGVASGDLSDLFTKNASIWSIGGNLLGPVLDGGRYRARTEQAEARAKQAEGQYQRAVENAFRDVNDALTNVSRAGEAEVDLQDYVAQSSRSLKLAQLRYEQGYSAYLEVLDAQRTLNIAQLALIRNRQAYLSYTVDLMNALGGGWAPDATATAPKTAKAS